MHVAILTSSLPPLAVGGAERQAWETARRLAARGHRVVVFARRMPPDAPAEETVDGVLRVRSAAPSLPGLSFAGHVRNFRRDWSRRRGGVEVVLAYQTVINGVLGTLAAGDRLPLVTWIRSEDEFDFRRAKFRHLTPYVLRRSASVLVQSRAIGVRLRDALAGTVGAETAAALEARTTALPNAVAIGPEPVRAGREGLLAVGQFREWKGFDVLLAALRRLDDPPPLTLVGQGPLEDRLRSLAGGLPVTFTGYVRDLGERMERARLLVAPSRTEGFPNVVLEAMERGLPAITTRVGGLADLVTPGETGLTVDPDDAAGLAAAVAAAYGDAALLDRMGRRSRETALAYGWDPHLDRLEELLAAAIRTRRG